MLVKYRMTPDPIIVRPDVSIAEALDQMRQDGVHRYPVVDSRGKLVGIVTESDLLYASPSPAHARSASTAVRAATSCPSMKSSNPFSRQTRRIGSVAIVLPSPNPSEKAMVATINLIDKSGRRKDLISGDIPLRRGGRQLS